MSAALKPAAVGPVLSGGSSSPGNTVVVEDNGVGINTASTLNFTGGGVTVTDAGGGQANISIPGGTALASAIIDTAIAGENLSPGHLVRFDTSGTPGEVLKAQATTLPAADLMGVVKSIVLSGATATYYERGTVPVIFGSAPAAASNGSRVYLDASTGGQATLIAPTASGTSVVFVGWLRGANGVTTTPNVQLKLDLLFVNP